MEKEVAVKGQMSCGPQHWMFRCNRHRLSLLMAGEKGRLLSYLDEAKVNDTEIQVATSATTSKENSLLETNFAVEMQLRKRALPLLRSSSHAANQLVADCRSKIAKLARGPFLDGGGRLLEACLFGKVMAHSIRDPAPSFTRRPYRSYLGREAWKPEVKGRNCARKSDRVKDPDAHRHPIPGSG